MPDSSNVFRIEHTVSGIRFGLFGKPRPSSAPTVFILSMTIEDSLLDENYARVGHLLAEKGFLCVSLDLPCHGDDAIPGVQNALDGWRSRIAEGEDIVSSWTTRASSVLDHLVSNGYSDPSSVVACGTSRGGFMAMHFAASDPRVRMAAAFCPLTDLLAIDEFDGMNDDPLTRSLSIANRAQDLVERDLWVCIGSDDQRVGTNNSVRFGQEVMRAAAARHLSPRIDLHVVSGSGHHTPEGAHAQAAEWVLRRSASASTSRSASK